MNRRQSLIRQGLASPTPVPPATPSRAPLPTVRVERTRNNEVQLRIFADVLYDESDYQTAISFTIDKQDLMALSDRPEMSGSLFFRIEIPSVDERFVHGIIDDGQSEQEINGRVLDARNHPRSPNPDGYHEYCLFAVEIEGVKYCLIANLPSEDDVEGISCYLKLFVERLRLRY